MCPCRLYSLHHTLSYTPARSPSSDYPYSLHSAAAREAIMAACTTTTPPCTLSLPQRRIRPLAIAQPSLAILLGVPAPCVRCHPSALHVSVRTPASLWLNLNNGDQLHSSVYVCMHVCRHAPMSVYVYCFTVYLLLYMYPNRQYTLLHTLPYTRASLPSSVCPLDPFEVAPEVVITAYTTTTTTLPSSLICICSVASGQPKLPNAQQPFSRTSAWPVCRHRCQHHRDVPCSHNCIHVVGMADDGICKRPAALPCTAGAGAACSVISTSTTRMPSLFSCHYCEISQRTAAFFLAHQSGVQASAPSVRC